MVTGWLGIAERDGPELGTNPFDYFDKLSINSLRINNTDFC